MIEKATCGVPVQGCCHHLASCENGDSQRLGSDLLRGWKVLRIGNANQISKSMIALGVATRLPPV